MSLTNKALFIIERNLSCELTLAGIARDCGVSRFHLAHAFGEATGTTVMDYVRGRRLTKAAQDLAAGAPNILDVALDAGYASHEAFSRAFKTQFGKTPEEVRKDADASALPLVRAFPPRETARIALAAPRFETLGAQTFVGLCEVVSYGKTHNYPGQWQRFMAGPYAEIEHKIPGIPVGINSQNDAGEMTYICAAEVSQTTQIPKGLTKIVLAPQTYVVFAHDDHVTRINDTYEAIWNEWFPASGKTPAEAPGFQRHNATFDPRTGNGGVTIWIPTK